MSSGYDAFQDPYCYTNSLVLKNKRALKDQDQLTQYEIEMTRVRSQEAFPDGRFGPAHYRAIHRHLFQDVYAWAGRYRTVRTAKGGNMFCFPEHISHEMKRAFKAVREPPFRPNSDRSDFIEAAAAFLADINAIHPFRDGNGRAQLSFLYLLARRAKHSLDLTKLEPKRFHAAMVESFQNRLTMLKQEIDRAL